MTEIVRVNGEAVTDRVLDANVARYIVQLEENPDSDFEPTDENLKFVRTEVLNYTIERMIILQLARKSGVTADNHSVIETIAKLKAEFDGETEWERNLLALHTTEAAMMEEIRDDLVIERYLGSQYEKRIEFTEEELKAYFVENEKFMKEPDTFSFYEIYAKDAEAVKTAAGILLEHGTIDDIEAKVAVAGTRVEDHADVPAHMVPPEVLNVISDLSVGKIGTIALPDNSFLVFRLNGRVEGRKLDYNDIKEKLAEYLIRQGEKEIYQELLDRARDAANIEYLDTSWLERKSK
jgi:hypothetical protein